MSITDVEHDTPEAWLKRLLETMVDCQPPIIIVSIQPDATNTFLQALAPPPTSLKISGNNLPEPSDPTFRRWGALQPAPFPTVPGSRLLDALSIEHRDHIFELIRAMKSSREGSEGSVGNITYYRLGDPSFPKNASVWAFFHSFRRSNGDERLVKIMIYYQASSTEKTEDPSSFN